MDLFLPLANGSFATETKIYGAAVLVHLCEIQLEVNSTRGLQGEPGIDWLVGNLGSGLSAKRLLLWRALEARRSRRRTELRLLCVHWELRRWCARVANLVRGNPSRVVNFGLDSLSAHLFYNVRNPNPQHTDGEGVLARFVVDCKLYLVGLPDFNVMVFTFPSVIACNFRTCDDVIFNLDGNKSLGATGEPRGTSMVYVPDLNNPE